MNATPDTLAAGPAVRIVVDVIGVSRTYGRGRTAVTAVREVTCGIETGARIAVTGPSGSGKSTLLHLLAGLTSPTTGSITWADRLGSARSRSTPLAMVFQGPSLLASLTVTENVALPLLFTGSSNGAATDRARTVLAHLQIDDLAAKLPDELSDGQAQRVALARVLATGPELIIADEPTARLDHRTAAHALDVLLADADAADAAVIVSTHDPVIAARFTQHWRMDDGHLDTGTPTPRHLPSRPTPGDEP